MIQHPGDDELLADPQRRDVELHVRGCARCRVQVRLLHTFFAADLADADDDLESVSSVSDVLERDARAVGQVALDAFGEPRLIGAGLRGPVYEAFDPELGRQVVVKVLAVPPDADALARAARYDGRHPHLAAWLHVDPDLRFVTRAAVEGETWDRATWHARPRRIALWAGQLASAVATLHTAGIVHGALQPENVRIEAGERLVVVDFGLGGPAGRSPYVAPELGSHDATGAGDWYAVGALLAEHAPGLDLGGLVDRLLDPDPTARPAAAEVLAALWVEQGDAGGLDATRFQLLDQLGVGGMGTVLAVFDPVLRRTVALKRMNARRAGHAVAGQRFRVEAQVTAQLQHPGIMPVYELGQLPDGTPYYTMKVVEKGRTLARLLRDRREGRGMVSLRDVLGVYLRVCEAMAYAHRRGAVVHRDLKPGNVLVGDYGEVLVSDWGLARVLDAPVDAAPRTVDVPDGGDALTREGSAAGTPGYMAPEQASSSGDRVGPASDVFALGVILYELLTGARPFPQDDEQARLRATRSGRWRSVSDVAPHAPAELAAVVERAMALDPADRYPDAGALAADVAAFQGEQEVSAYSYSALERLERAVRPYQGYLAVGAVAAALLIAVGLVAVQSRSARVAAEAQGMLERARLADRAGDRVRAELYAAEAVRLADRPEGRGILGALWREGYPTLSEARDQDCADLIVTGTPSRVVCRSSAGAVSAWSAGEPAARAVASDGGAIAVGPLGAVVVATADAVSVFDAVSGEILDSRPARSPTGVTLVRDGAVALASRDRLHLDGHASPALGADVVDLMACGPRSPLVARLADDRIVRWTPESGLEELPVDADRATASACSSDGRLALGIGSQVDIWMLDPPRELARLVGHGGPLRALSWSRDDGWLASGSDDGTVRVWDARRQVELARLPGHDGVTSLAFGDDGALVSAVPGRVRTWQPPASGGVPEVDAMVELREHGWTSDGALTTLDRHGGLGTWDPATGRPTSTLRLPGTRSAAVGPGGLVVVGSSDGQIRLVDPRTREERWAVQAHDAPVDAIAWDPGSGVVVSVAADGVARAWAASEQGRSLGTWRTEGAGPMHLALSSDGGRMLLFDADGRAELWSVPSGVPIEDEVVERATAVALDGSGGQLAVGLPGGTVELRGLSSGARTELRGHDDDVVALAFSPGGDLVATASLDRTVRVFAADTGRELARMYTRLQRPSHVHFAPDGAVLSASGRDRAVLLWDVDALRADKRGLVERVESRYGAAVDGANVTFTIGLP